MKDPITPMLQTASLHGLLIALSKTFARSNFGDVQILDRRGRKQKSRFGGHEILCETVIGTYPVKIAVKVVQDQIRTRMVDELAGTVLRTGCDLGILVSPYNRSRSVDALQGVHKPVRIEFLTGDQLAGLFRQAQVGIRGAREVDYAYFSGIEEVACRVQAFLAKEDL